MRLTQHGQEAHPPVVHCKGCGGTAERREDRRPPAGWLGLTVAVPVGMNSRGYIWLGQWCSVACLAASVPEMRRQEALAHQAYEPVPARRAS